MTVIQLRLPKAVDRCLARMSEHAAQKRIQTIAFIAVTPEGYVADVCGDHGITSEMLLELHRKVATRQRNK